VVGFVNTVMNLIDEICFNLNLKGFYMTEMKIFEGEAACFSFSSSVMCSII
jgi:hypothetical protein